MGGLYFPASRLGPPLFYPFLGGGFNSTKILSTEKVGTLLVTSLLEDLVKEKLSFRFEGAGEARADLESRLDPWPNRARASGLSHS